MTEPAPDARDLTVKEWMSVLSDQLATIDASVENRLAGFSETVRELKQEVKAVQRHATALAEQREVARTENEWLREQLVRVLSRTSRLSGETHEHDEYGNVIR